MSLSIKERLGRYNRAEKALTEIFEQTSSTKCDVGKWPRIYATSWIGTNPEWADLKSALDNLKRRGRNYSIQTKPVG